jgi:hypothetical protein
MEPRCGSFGATRPESDFLLTCLPVALRSTTGYRLSSFHVEEGPAAVALTGAVSGNRLFSMRTNRQQISPLKLNWGQPSFNCVANFGLFGNLALARRQLPCQ